MMSLSIAELERSSYNMQIKALENWYKANQRDLPFRKTTNPYLIWISEIMLQQTQVETVLPFYNRFISKYPTVFELAAAPDDDLKKDVEGLGYYRRFANMKKTAQVIVDNYQGVFPTQYNDILNLPGIGRYTAGAIMSIAYNKPYSALDGNVIRVLSRYLGNPMNFRIEKHKKDLDLINQIYIESATPKLYTPALMELGALVCRPKTPKCALCPINTNCFAYQNNQVDQFPYLSKLKDKKEIHYITLIIEDEAFYYLRKRDEELLNGMYEYIQFEAESLNTAIDELAKQHIDLDVYQSLKELKHVFTHQVWHMDVYLARLNSLPASNWVAIPKNKLSHYPMAIAHRKIKKEV